MTDQHSFDVVFRGDICAGETLAVVRQRLGELFRLDPARLDQLFSGRPVVLRRGLDSVAAERFRTLLEEAGALVQLRATSDQPTAAPTAAAVHPEPSAGVNAASTSRTASVAGPSVAPVGAELLRPEERLPVKAPVLSLDHLSLAEPGSDVLRADERRPFEPRSLDVSHLSLSP